MDIDLCSFGLCGERTLICAETRGGHDVTCTCERGERPLYLPCPPAERSADKKVSVSFFSFFLFSNSVTLGVIAILIWNISQIPVIYSTRRKV